MREKLNGSKSRKYAGVVKWEKSGETGRVHTNSL